MNFPKHFASGLLAAAVLSLSSSIQSAEGSDGILSIHPAFELEYGTVSNRFYQLQGTTNVADSGSWTNIGGLQMGDGGNITTFVSSRNDPSQFYRVVISDFGTGLVAHYKLDGDADDETAFANNGTLAGATATTNRFGAASSALHFDGASNGAQVPDAPGLNFTNAFTLSAWVNFRSGGSSNPRLISKATIAADGYQLLTEGTGTLRRFNCTIGIEGIGYIGVATANLYPAGNWHHVVAVYDGTALRLYVNGTPDGEIAAAGAIKQTAVQMHLGGQSAYADDYFLGDLDDVRLHNRALSPVEVGLLFNTPD